MCIFILHWALQGGSVCPLGILPLGASGWGLCSPAIALDLGYELPLNHSRVFLGPYIESTAVYWPAGNTVRRNRR